jgi:hypothetical protein
MLLLLLLLLLMVVLCFWNVCWNESNEHTNYYYYYYYCCVSGIPARMRVANVQNRTNISIYSTCLCLKHYALSPFDQLRIIFRQKSRLVLCTIDMIFS